MPEILPNWHPIVVHFAIGLLFTSGILFAFSSLMASRPFAAAVTAAARLDLGLGVVAALIALATGWQAYNNIAHDTPSHANMTIHMKWALATVALFVAASAAAWLDRRRVAGASVGVLAALALASGSLGATGWLGGENVYRFGLGVMSLPKTDGHDHGAHHHHDDADEYGHADKAAGSVRTPSPDAHAGHSAGKSGGDEREAPLDMPAHPAMR